jgi:hypothetical protein
MNQSIEPSQSPEPRPKSEEQAKAILEYITAHDAEERLLQAYELIFKDMLSGEFNDPSEAAKSGEQQKLF